MAQNQKLENIPAAEPQQIQHIVELTLQQLQKRYPGNNPVLRGVHPKSHGCVTAEFHVNCDLPNNFRHGVFAVPGHKYAAMVRFSNAATLVAPDSPTKNGVLEHGSRGMAIKLLGVTGTPLGHVNGSLTQDFLMINQPVFAFANVEDYEALSQVLVTHNDDPRPFFAERLPKNDGSTPTASQLRAKTTGGIVARIRALSTTATPPAFQHPPASPVDNDYFGASPFLLGPDQVMRFRVRPRNPSSAEPAAGDPNYLRNALVRRLQDKCHGPVVFDFEVQVRPASEIDADRDIENASSDWPAQIPFHPVATLTIPLQVFDTPQLNAHCESLVFTPWHGLEAHRPLGGINRLRRAVYEASAMFRHLPKEPATLK